MYLREVSKNIKNYYITDKLDGKRSVIMITEHSSVAITDIVVSLDIESKHTYIFDTELYNDEYYIFDIMVWKDEVITDQPFEKRLSYFEKAAELSALFKLKPFIRLTDDYQSQLKSFKKEKKQYDIDGIILTPYDGNYNTMKVYKYKPVEKMSVDFLIKKCPDKLLGIAPYIQEKNNQLYLLFCGISSNMYNKLNMKFIKHYEDIFNTVDTFHLPKYFPIQFQPSNKTYAYLFWDEKDDLDGQVGEFVYNINDNLWNLHKIREDRKVELSRGNYYGNNYKIAENIWMSYYDPLVIEDLSEEDSYFQEHDNQLQKASRNFNSFVKSKIFERYKEIDWVMDLASGKGQDLFRYGTYGMKNVIFLEIDNSALSELLARKFDFADNTERNRMNIMLHQVDLNQDYKSNTEKIEELHIPNTGVDLIVCNFAFHYFISDKKHLLNIIKFINHYLKPGGRFIFTAFDGKEIIQLLNANNGNWTIRKGNDIKYSIKKQYKLNVLEPIGQKIDVLLPFSNEEYYSEYLVNIDYISSEFASYNMILETDQSFRDYLADYSRSNKRNYDSMDVDDKKYVGLYHYYCFYKQNQSEKVAKGSSNRRYRR
jgi:SAM-dependent methyltransferase